MAAEQVAAAIARIQADRDFAAAVLREPEATLTAEFDLEPNEWRAVHYGLSQDVSRAIDFKKVKWSGTGEIAEAFGQRISPTVVPGRKMQPTVIPGKKMQPTIVPSKRAATPTVIPAKRMTPTIIPSKRAATPTVIPAKRMTPTIIPSKRAATPTVIPAQQISPTKAAKKATKKSGGGQG